MGLVFSILTTAATAAAVVYHIVHGDVLGVFMSLLGTSVFGKLFGGLAAKPIGWIAGAFGKGSALHKAAQLLVVGNLGGLLSFGRGAWHVGVALLKTPSTIAGAVKGLLGGSSGLRSAEKVGKAIIS